MSITFPGGAWEDISPGDARMDADKLDAVGRWLTEESAGRAYRIMVVRHGCAVARWRSGLTWNEPIDCASAAKSVYSSLLGIAEAEGAIGSADDLAADYYPEMLDVPEGTGPKPGRFVRDKDANITLRQLICNTSGYLKPFESPGQVLNYQTFGMNVLCHAIRRAYGAESCGALIEEKIRNPIGAGWTWRYTNFDLPESARIEIFGNYTQLESNPDDLCRLGWTWCNRGVWNGTAVVPGKWLERAVKATDGVKWDDSRAELCYGAGFWTNDRGRLWPGLPVDGFAAYGAGEIAVVVFPSLDLVIAQSPGIFTTGDHAGDGTGVLRRVVEACSA